MAADGVVLYRNARQPEAQILLKPRQFAFLVLHEILHPHLDPVPR